MGGGGGGGGSFGDGNFLVGRLGWCGIWRWWLAMANRVYLKTL